MSDTLYTLVVKPFEGSAISLLEYLLYIWKIQDVCVINRTVEYSKVSMKDIEHILHTIDCKQIRNVSFEIKYHTYVKNETIIVANDKKN